MNEKPNLFLTGAINIILIIVLELVRRLFLGREPIWEWGVSVNAFFLPFALVIVYAKITYDVLHMQGRLQRFSLSFLTQLSFIVWIILQFESKVFADEMIFFIGTPLVLILAISFLFIYIPEFIQKVHQDTKRNSK